ncbi:MAG: MFS transporter, partial [Theionarchaea archaeon]|nr:MFS transporter [Theionarchaea archaeon]
KEPVVRRLRFRFNEIRESTYFLTLLGLMVATFITTFGLTLIEPLLSIYAQEKVDATLTEISLAFTFMGLSGFLVRVVGSDVSDRVGRRKPILFGNLWAALLTFPLTIVRTPVQMIGILAARSAGWGFSDPATQALLADIVEENKRGRIFGLFGSVSGVAMIAGPTVGGAVYELYGGEVSFALCGALTLVASTVLFLMITEPSHEEAPV